MSEQEAIEKVKKFLHKWAAFEVNMGNSPGPLYTSGFKALASVIKAEAVLVLPALEALADASSEAWNDGYEHGCDEIEEYYNA